MDISVVSLNYFKQNLKVDVPLNTKILAWR